MTAFKNILELSKKTAKEWKSHKPLLIGAGISFYVLLSLGPILSLLVLTASSLWGEQAVQGDFVHELRNLVGQKPAQTIQDIIQNASEHDSNTITILTSIPLLFFGSTMIFFQIRNALNIIWETESSRPEGIKEKMKRYSFSFLMLLIIGILFILFIFKNPIIALATDQINNLISIPPFLLRIVDYLFSYIILTILFAAIYKILTDVEICWADIWVGALITALLFIIVQIIMRINAANSNIDNAFGAIGSFTILFLWIFYSALIFLFGAEFTKVFAKKYGTFSKTT